ncbi:MAG: porin family protein [Bacteroidia bacterium]|nr:porin family protein [Bacteroidia bacterium]
MKKLTLKLFTVVSLLAAGTFGASAQSYEQGSSQLNIGLGLGSTLSGAGFSTTIPPIGISYEYGLKEKISVGGYLGYAGSSNTVTYPSGDWKWNYNYIIIGARGSYHFATSDKLDPYAGVLLGYNAASTSVTKPAGYTGPDITAASAGGLVYGFHLGARYYFTDKIGAFGEIGYGIAWLNLGLTMKF